MELGRSPGPSALWQVSGLSSGTRASLTASASGPSEGERSGSGLEGRPPSGSSPTVLPLCQMQPHFPLVLTLSLSKLHSPFSTSAPHSSPAHPKPPPYLRKEPPSLRWHRECRQGAPGTPGAGTRGVRPPLGSRVSTAAQGLGHSGKSAGRTRAGTEQSQGLGFGVLSPAVRAWACPSPWGEVGCGSPAPPPPAPPGAPRPAPRSTGAHLRRYGASGQ